MSSENTSIILARARQLAGSVSETPGIGKLSRISAPQSQRAIKSFDATIFNRLTGDWQVSRLSADAELQGKLAIIRSRSRDHEQNDPYVEGFYKLRENNVVGHDGFTLQMKVKLSEELDPATGEMAVKLDTVSNRAIERGWKRFCLKENFLVTRDQHATEACKLIERTLQRDGDLLIRKVKGAPNEFGFALQLLEADYLDDQFVEFRGVACNCPNERRLPDGSPFPYCQTGRHEVRMGVELHGDWKFPVAYWLLANHPGDYFYGNQYATRRIRVPVEEIIHPFVKKRIEQTRGLPATVAAMLRLQMLGGMDEALLVKARAGAQKMGIITKDVPEGLEDQFEKDALGQAMISGAPGEFLELPMGFDIKSIDWKATDEGYAPFQKAQLRAAAAGGGVSYSSFANDPSDANFSATRIGMLEEREGYRGGQQFFINHILLEAFPDFLEAAMLRGIVALPFSRFEEFTDHEAVSFHGRNFPYIDPLKDVQAAKEAIELGVESRSDFCAENGKDFEEVTATLGREKQLRENAGLGETQPENPAIPASEKPGETDDPADAQRALKSAFLGEVALGDLPEHVADTVGQFVTGADATSKVLRYQMTVPELLDKADQHNLKTAQRRLRNRTNISCAAEVRERADKHILILNDRIIDGHHHLAKAEKGKITSSLAVLDLTPLRYQCAAGASAIKGFNPSESRDEDGKWTGGAGISVVPKSKQESSARGAKPQPSAPAPAEAQKTTAEQDEAISSYQDGSYQEINRALREGSSDELEDWQKSIISDLDAAMERNELPEAATLYRSGMPPEMLKGLKPGDVVSDSAFQSTSFSSASEETTDIHFGKTLAEIRAPKGTHGIFVSGGEKGYDKEQEFLLPRNTALRFVGTNGKNFVFEIVKQSTAR